MVRAAAAIDQTAVRSPRVRSAVSNGALPGGVSKCSAEGRRFADVVHDLSRELGGDLSPSEVIDVQSIAGLVLHAEQLQAAVLKGESVDSDQFVRVANSASRLIASLRRGRSTRKAKPTSALAAHLAKKAAAGVAS